MTRAVHPTMVLRQPRTISVLLLLLLSALRCVCVRYSVVCNVLSECVCVPCIPVTRVAKLS